MNAQRTLHHYLRRSLLLALLSALVYGVPSGSAAQEEAQEPAGAPQADATQDEQSLKQQLQAAERLRRELEAELKRLRGQVDALNQGRQPATTPAPPATPQPSGPPIGVPGTRIAPRGLAQAETTHLKIFRLRHRDANEMAKIVLQFAPRESGPDAPVGGAPGSGQPARLQQAGGVASPGGPAGRSDDLRVVADPRSGSILVRATEKTLAQVEKLVKMFDVPPGTVPVFEDQSRGVFTVRHADPEHVVGLLRDLGVDAMLAPNTNTLSVQGSETTLKEIGELIEALDVDESGE